MHQAQRLGDRLLLRELAPADVDAVHAIYGDPRATEHLSFDPRSRDQVEQIVARSIEAARADERHEYALAVVEQAGGDLVGFGRLALDPHQPRAATMGFALRASSWGRGYGVETVRLLLAVAFDDLGVHRVWGARSPANEASARTMERAGMVVEGRIREHIQRGGRWRDSIVYAVLDHEWQSINK